MKISPNGDISDFCCAKFDEASRPPVKTIAIDLLWKDNYTDTPHPRACSLKASGTAADMFGAGVPAGKSYIPLDNCPFCNAPLLFEKGDEVELNLTQLEKDGKIKLMRNCE